MGTVLELRSVADELSFDVTEGNVSIHDSRIYLLEIMTTILKTARRAELDMDQLFGGQLHLLADITTFTTECSRIIWHHLPMHGKSR